MTANPDLDRAMGFDPVTVAQLREQVQRINSRPAASRRIAGCTYPPGWEQTDVLAQLAEAGATT